jgi:hypothetical protein
MEINPHTFKPSAQDEKEFFPVTLFWWPLDES